MLLIKVLIGCGCASPSLLQGPEGPLQAAAAWGPRLAVGIHLLIAGFFVGGLSITLLHAPDYKQCHDEGSCMHSLPFSISAPVMQPKPELVLLLRYLTRMRANKGGLSDDCQTKLFPSTLV